MRWPAAGSAPAGVEERMVIQPLPELFLRSTNPPPCPT
jgi:hypothetical protein